MFSGLAEVRVAIRELIEAAEAVTDLAAASGNPEWDAMVRLKDAIAKAREALKPWV